MNLELLTCRRVTSGILYPPSSLQKGDLTRLYAEINERYEYGTFHFLPDGARMAQLEDELLIQQTRIQVNEAVQVHFEMAKEKTLDLFQIITTRLGLRQFLAFGTKIIATLPADGAMAATTFIERSMLKITEEQFGYLGPGRRGTGIRMNFQKEGSIYDLRIEPFFADLSQIYIELDAQFPQPFNDLSGIEGKMDKVYGYLFGEVRDFLGVVAK